MQKGSRAHQAHSRLSRACTEPRRTQPQHKTQSTPPAQGEPRSPTSLGSTLGRLGSISSGPTQASESFPAASPTGPAASSVRPCVLEFFSDASGARKTHWGWRPGTRPV